MTPTPRAPCRPRPHAHSWPPAVTKRVWWPPAASDVIGSSMSLRCSTRQGHGTPLSHPAAVAKATSPSPSWPWRHAPHDHTLPQSVRHTVWLPPATARVTFMPLSASRRCSGPASLKCPCPSWPWRPRPHVHSPPPSLTITVWFAPVAICVTLTPAIEFTCRGMSTSIGVHPPWPSSPLEASPHVMSTPSGSTAAQCDAPQDTLSIAVVSLMPASAPKETAAGAAASS